MEIKRYDSYQIPGGNSASLIIDKKLLHDVFCAHLRHLEENKEIWLDHQLNNEAEIKGYLRSEGDMLIKNLKVTRFHIANVIAMTDYSIALILSLLQYIDFTEIEDIVYSEMQHFMNELERITDELDAFEIFELTVNSTNQRESDQDFHDLFESMQEKLKSKKWKK